MRDLGHCTVIMEMKDGAYDPIGLEEILSLWQKKLYLQQLGNSVAISFGSSGAALAAALRKSTKGCWRRGE